MIRLSECVPVLLVVCAAISGPAQAADPEMVKVAVYGAGTASCGTWLADREKPMHDYELSWVLGWLTASSYFYEEDHLGRLRHTDANAVSAWLDKYCREHPLESISLAAAQLDETLAKPE